MKTRLLLCGLVWGACSVLQAAPLTESSFTDVFHDVNVVTLPANSATPAHVKDLFKSPDLVRTGPDSRAELTAPDQTITRVGANTVFSFEPTGRDINLEQGSVLFHSPTGKGGGTIKSGGAAAAVLGTTLIVVTTPDGKGFKVILLEGKGRVTLRNSHHRILHAGQMVFVLPGQSDFGPVLDINLAKLVDGSKLVTGFSTELASMPRIREAIRKQQRYLSKGRAEDTGISADNFAVQRNIPGNGIGTIDDITYHLGVIFPTVKPAPVIVGVNAGPPEFPAPPPIIP